MEWPHWHWCSLCAGWGVGDGARGAAEEQGSNARPATHPPMQNATLLSLVSGCCKLNIIYLAVLHFKWSPNCYLAHRNIIKCSLKKFFLQFIHVKDYLFITMLNNIEYVLQILFSINISYPKRTAEKNIYTYKHMCAYMHIYLHKTYI